ncbi:MAG: DUF2612 domain-containing protein [Pseudomonadota bacterium]
MADDITPIREHAERALELLPSQHAQVNWGKLIRSLIGARGMWADENVFYLFRINSTVPNLKSFVCADSMLDTIFAPAEATLARIGTMTLPAFSSADLVDKSIQLWELIGDPGVTLALALAGDEMRALMESHAIRELPADDGEMTNSQLVALVECELAGAPSGAQELEGELIKLLVLRRIALAFGEQLDELGDLLGQTRDGLTDEEYRPVLRMKAGVNVSHGTIPEAIAIADQCTGVTSVQLQESFPACFDVYLYEAAGTETERALLRQSRAEGVDMAIVSMEGDRPLVFGPDSGWHRIVSASGNDIIVENDVTSCYAVGDTVRVAGSRDCASQGDYTVSAVALDSPPDNTIITVTTTVAVALPAILENVSRGVQDPDGFGLGEAFVIDSSDGLNVIYIDGDCSDEFAVAQCIRVSDDATDVYRIYSVQYYPEFYLTALTLTRSIVSPAGKHVQIVSPAVAEAVNPAFTDVTDAPVGDMADEWDDP